MLFAAGICTWAELAANKASAIKEILAAAGNRYKMHDPKTWSKQAKLAAKGKWDQLQVLQDQLKGGR